MHTTSTDSSRVARGTAEHVPFARRPPRSFNTAATLSFEFVLTRPAVARRRRWWRAPARMNGIARIVIAVAAILAGAQEAGAQVVANFTVTPNPAAPAQAITFDGSSSHDLDPRYVIVFWSWDFGDGSASAFGATLTHAFNLFGSYTSKLVVTDDQGLHFSDT